MPKIVIDAGHGGDDGGATYKGRNEKDVTLAVALELHRRLGLDLGFDSVFLTRAVDVRLSLRSRCDLANRIGADLFISIHCNADPDVDMPGDHVATGDEIWVYPGHEKSLAFAKILQRHASAYSQTHRGIRESDRLYVLRKTRMLAALVEIGFIDDPTFSDNPPIIAAATALHDAIMEYING